MPPPPLPAPDETNIVATIVPGVDLSTQGGGPASFPVMVSLTPPDGKDRTPADICCVVDVSGSMSTEALIKSEGGEQAGHGLSVLDIVKHALRTIINNLTDFDRLALVAYSNDARTIFGLTDMTVSGRTSTESQLGDLTPSGMTNLWDGLKTAFELLKAGSQPGRLQHIMLFTDGLPNINPPRGILPMLKRLKDKEGGRLPCTINTYGFGYELDSELLNQLAIDGSGAYAFIPDAGFVGTVFVNALGNLLATVAKDATLTLEPQNGASFVGDGILGGYPLKKDGGKIIANVGSLQFGQTKDVVVQMSVPSVSSGYLTVSCEYGTRAGTQSTCTCNQSAVAAPFLVEQRRLQVRAVEGCRQAMKAAKLSNADKAAGKALPLPAAQEVVAALAAEIQSSSAGNEESITMLLEDVTGQVTEALSREEWYTRWGIHWLPSLMSAHLMQQCNNFKDAGVQNYGGDVFQNVRDAADEVFITLPAPTPSVRPPAPATPTGSARPSGMSGIFGMAAFASQGGSPAASPATAAPVNMAAFHDRYAGCIDGAAFVELANGSHQRVADVRKGDLVAAFGGGPAEVACVVRTQCPTGRFLLSQMPDGGPRLTSHHPVFVTGEWRFPTDIVLAEEVPCHSVYAFMLRETGQGTVARGHGHPQSFSPCAVIVQGVPCICLGHGLEDGAARHPFFGCRRTVEQSLGRLPGYENGLVELGLAIRDPATGLVCGFDMP